MDNGASSYRRFLDGDETAFREIMEEYHHGLVFFIHGYVQDIHTAEDIAIDVFSDLIVHKHRYNFKIALKSYLYMLGRSRALDHIKHRTCRPMVELSQAEALKDETAALEELIFADERKRKIHTAMAQLPEDIPHVFISSFTQEGIKELKDMLWSALQTENAPEEEVTVLFPGDDNEKPIV